MKKVFCLVFISYLSAVAGVYTICAAPDRVVWNDCLKQKPEWYRGGEALRIADNVLAYQRKVGGWPKNIDMAAVLTEIDRTSLVKQKQQDEDATIDNGATFTQLVYLARVYEVQKLERHKAAFLLGLDYLLKAQYANGGWPQYYPLKKGYYSRITYNDNAMVGVVKLLRDVARQRTAYAFVDADRRLKAAQAVQKAIECFLKSQVRVDGKLTVWCAQHDEHTLAPAAARTFEPVSLSGMESVGIVRFLMGIDQPGKEVIESIEAATAWFRKTQIDGVRWVERKDPTKLHGFDRLLIKDTEAGPLWARFYELGTNRPIFQGRDSVVRYTVAEIEDERRNGYQWYVSAPEELLQRDYPAWQSRLARIH